MASGLIGNEVPFTGLRVRVPCPPLGKFSGVPQGAPDFRFLPLSAAISKACVEFCIKCLLSGVVDYTENGQELPFYFTFVSFSQRGQKYGLLHSDIQVNFCPFTV